MLNTAEKIVFQDLAKQLNYSPNKYHILKVLGELQLEFEHQKDKIYKRNILAADLKNKLIKAQDKVIRLEERFNQFIDDNDLKEVYAQWSINA